MGFGSYSASDWTKLKESRKLSNTQSVSEVFKKQECDPKFDPRFIGTRECFDSADHPNTTPIVVGLDVTASMGYLAVEIATKALNELIMKLYSTGAVEDPALMCAAYGDYQDASPLQITQFESDIRIAEQLLELYFENRGSGQVVPTCLWDYLSNHTNIDAINKRGEKGFVFTIGDKANIRQDYISQTLDRVIGDTPSKAPNTPRNLFKLFNPNYQITREDILKQVEKKFNVFHIVVDSAPMKDSAFLHGHVMHINKSDISIIPELIISTIQLQKGMSIDSVITQWDETSKQLISSVLKQLTIVRYNEDINL